MNKDYNIMFFEYLDKAVNWEKEKQQRLQMAKKPFDKEEILNIIEDYELDKLKSSTFCLERMKMIKVLHNVFTRRLYTTIVRENFEHINFKNLKDNSIYNDIKKDIFKQYPDLTFVEDDKLLRQIANGIAHGNYISLLNMQNLENVWTDNGKNEIKFNKKNKTNFYVAQSFKQFEDREKFNEKSKKLIDKTIDAIKPHKVSDARVFLNILNNTIDSDSKIETLDFKYESNLMLDQAGNVVRRPSTRIFNLKINRSQLEMLTFLLVVERNTFNYLMEESTNPNSMVEIPANALDCDVAKYILSNNKFYIVNEIDGIKQEIALDKYQQEIFINEYVDSRKLFDKTFFKNIKNEQFQDILATNQNSHAVALSGFYFPNFINQSFVDIAIEDSERIFDLAAYTFKQNKSKSLIELIAKVGKYAYSLKQVFNTYTESLITETLLLLQVIEDKGLLQFLENNAEITNILKTFDQNQILALKNSPKYKNDIQLVLYHLRNSFSHIKYLNNLNKEIFIYDFISKKNKTPEFKFAISIENLEKIKNQLLISVKEFYKTENKINEDTLNKDAEQTKSS